jgi:glycosyltransferase involved in cell wall biosynthesis
VPSFSKLEGKSEMRIAVVSWSRRRVGGVEAYLADVLPGIQDAGHSVAFWYETDEATDRERIALPTGVPSWCVAELGREAALEALKGWHPDLLYVHGMIDVELEAELGGIAPAIFFAHAYQGTCISGAKTTRLPTVTPCHREFGARCLLRYYPLRCGGLNPQTMWLDYRRQTSRLELLREYDAIVVHSQHMRREYLRHGLSPNRLFQVPFLIAPPAGAAPETSGHVLSERGRRLLFMGRMDALKGGEVLLDALPKIRRELGHPLLLVFAGDGPERGAWERHAAAIAAMDPEIRVDFVGWTPPEGQAALLREADLLVCPSIWPEPFGRVGPEAGYFGVPVAGFAVGGVPEWLSPGENGHLAPGDPPTADGLADAVVSCLRDPEAYQRLRAGAYRLAQRFTREEHVPALLEVFRTVLRSRDAATGAAPVLSATGGAADYPVQ